MVILTLNEIELSPPLAQGINLLSSTIKFLSAERIKIKKKGIEHHEDNTKIEKNPQMGKICKVQVHVQFRCGHINPYRPILEKKYER